MRTTMLAADVKYVLHNRSFRGSCHLVIGVAIVAAALTNCQSAGAVAITWNVAGSGVWDTTTANWTGGSTFYTDGDDVTFNNTAGGSINLTANRAPLTTTVSATSGTYTFTNNNITSGTLTKSNAGTLVMNSQYTSSGAISVTGGTLRLGASDRLADTAAIGGGGTWDMNGFNETIRWAGSGAVHTTNMGNLTVVHPYLADRSGVGIMSGPGSLTFGTGHNTSIIRDTHTYAGGTFINNGFVALYSGATNQFPATGDMTVATGATFSLSWHAAGGNVRTIGGLSGGGSIFSDNTNTFNNTLRPGNGGASSTFSGIFSGAGSLDKVGAGVLTLSGNNSYTGTTAVTAGTLLVNGTTGPGQGNYTVAGGATLGGSGTIRLAGGNSVNVANLGILAPGNSAGTLNITGNLLLNNTTDLQWELGNPSNPLASDKVAITGNLTLDGVLNITLLPGYGNGTYTLMTYTGSFLDNGVTVNDPYGSAYTLDTSNPGLVLLQVEFPVPEPSTLTLLGLGAAVMVRQARRRRQR